MKKTNRSRAAPVPQSPSEVAVSGGLHIAKKQLLHEDGRWYEINPPQRITVGRKPMNWRPTGRKLGPGKRAEVITQANKRDW